MSKQKFKPDVCQCCGQTITYLLPIDQGTVDILKSISIAIRNKGKNSIHPRNEMEVHRGNLTYQQMVQEGVLTSNHVGNLSRARFHGLIARIEGERGVYCLTRKGAKFLKGEPMSKFAVISKSEKHNIGYFNPVEEICTIKDFSHDGPEYWEGIDYEFYSPGGNLIKDGQCTMF